MVIAYLIGSIPFGVILSKIFKLPDPRSIGSGNIGATNMLRTGRKDIAAATLALDMLKGVVAVAVMDSTAPYASALAVLAAVLGHCFPVWLHFKGGKGVATILGGLLAFSWSVGFFTLLIWVAMFYYKRISSLAALTALSLTPFAAMLSGGGASALVILIAVLVVVANHADNMRRLINGTEPVSNLFGKKDGQ
ncbi:MAG: glycerol-3-phosphate 1-O-acyltransferase PlsY [Alphaproteobacteria bacterium]|nr:glycerol-3-phosphate 1-O-acyltransferase PlsY [Alphaproteobacteria bacterium]